MRFFQFPSPCGGVVLKWANNLALYPHKEKFPSPCGDVVLKWRRYDRDRLKVWRFPSPCGDVVLKSVPCVWPHQGTLVSVPLRGYGFEMLVYEYEGHYYWEFPSPCGDVVLKLCRDSGLCRASTFPSPCGDVVLKSPTAVQSSDIGSVSVPLRGCGFEMSALPMPLADTLQFPSPCGDMVLKIEYNTLYEVIAIVSVPLWGYGFEILHWDALC